MTFHLGLLYLVLVAAGAFAVTWCVLGLRRHEQWVESNVPVMNDTRRRVLELEQRLDQEDDGDEDQELRRMV